LRVKGRKVEEGKDRVRLLEDVKKDRREMKVEKWREKAVDRDEWVPVMEEAKAFSGP
jgi:hypothetical protein